jgi:hypothetical protein
MKKLGFGGMRLPLLNADDVKTIDQDQVNKMADYFIEHGFTYFDTAYPYHMGLSEVAFKRAVVERYPREAFLLADKMPTFAVKKTEDYERLFNEQLERCGVEYFDYYFKVDNPPGTHLYHSHVNVAKQDMLGLMGGFVILDPEDSIDRDYLLLVQEWKLEGPEKGKKVEPGSYKLDPYAMDFNMFTINGKSFPATTPMPIKYGDSVRLRFGATQVNHHPMHLHGHQFLVEKADGNPIDIKSRILKNTILVATGETWDVLFNANNPGVWPIHCHISHHMSNNFTDGMGGMFSTLVYQ